MGIGIEISSEMIETFCRRNHIRSFSFFGSVLRRDFGVDSDVDVLVEFEGSYCPDLLEIVRMENALTEMFGHRADLVERESVVASKNYIRRRRILESMETVYVAG